MIFGYVCWLEGGVGCGWGLDAPAHNGIVSPRNLFTTLKNFMTAISKK